MPDKKNLIISDIREKILDLCAEYANNSIQIIIDVPPMLKKPDGVKIKVIVTEIL